MDIPDYQDLMDACLAALPEEVDKREGSLIQMALGPVCLRLAEAYAMLEGFYDLVFSDTAAGGYLDRLAGQYGVTRKAASRALRLGKFTNQAGGAAVPPLGSRFYQDQLFFVAEELLADGQCALRCETAGSAGNRGGGELLPAEYLADFGTAELLGVLIPGEDEESDASLRERLGERLSAPAFGGNVADYREKVRAIPGVGAVRVVPAASGGGTVKLILLDGRLLPPEETLLAVVEEKICGGGNGLGLAPIGHTVEIIGAEAVPIKLTASVTRRKESTAEAAEAAVWAAAERQLELLRRRFEEEPAVVRLSAMVSGILAAEGVADVQDLRINGEAANLTLEAGQAPVLDKDGSRLSWGVI